MSRQRGSCRNVSSRRNALFGIAMPYLNVCQVYDTKFLSRARKSADLSLWNRIWHARATQARASSICIEQNHRRTCIHIYIRACTYRHTYLHAPHKHISQTQSRNRYPIPSKKMPTTTASSRFEQENTIYLDIHEKWCKLIYKLNQCLFRKFFRYCKNRKTRSTGSKRDDPPFFLLHLQSLARISL